MRTGKTKIIDPETTLLYIVVGATGRVEPDIYVLATPASALKMGKTKRKYKLPRVFNKMGTRIGELERAVDSKNWDNVRRIAARAWVTLETLVSSSIRAQLSTS